MGRALVIRGLSLLYKYEDCAMDGRDVGVRGAWSVGRRGSMRGVEASVVVAIKTV